MGENHVIEVRYSYSGGDGDNTARESGGALLSKSANASGMTKMSSFIGVSAAAILAQKAVQISNQVVQAELSRIGEYTGNDQLQSNLDNVFSQWRGIASFIKNPIQGIVSEHYRIRDYRLQIAKQNDNAEYNRKLMLHFTNKGGTKI